MPIKWKDKHIELQFEGVYRNSEVYLNGLKVGGCKYGYSPFFVTLDDHLNYGEENEIKVVADNSEDPDSRWYSGGGIYRSVWLWMGEREYIRPEGVKIKTISYDPAVINVKTGTEKACEIKIYDCNELITSTVGIDVDIKIENAKLWSDEDPHLYDITVSLDNDTAETKFGIRKLEWSSNGFFVNGKKTLLRGGCIHHDNGILGARSFDESERRKIKILKENGFNAIRSAHNPTSRGILEACDELGVYVMDELWDMWYFPCNKGDYSLDWRKYHEYDMSAMTERDYNHPSVIMYSIGNEVTEPAFLDGIEMTKELVEKMHALDDTRPVTMGLNLILAFLATMSKTPSKDRENRREDYDKEALKKENDNKNKKEIKINSTLFNLMSAKASNGMSSKTTMKAIDKLVSPSLDLLDIAGYNYATPRYEIDKKLHSDRLIVGTETYPQDIVKNWSIVERGENVIGDFMWTAWDYLGEAGIGAWAYTADGNTFTKPYPWLLGDVGAFDILGNETAEVALAKAAWHLLKEPYIGVRPVKYNYTPSKGVWRGTNCFASWSWKGCEGNKAYIEVYAEGKYAELFLNGKKIGKKKLKDHKATFKTKYESGVLSVRTYDNNGTVIGQSFLESAKGELNLSLTSEKNTIKIGHIAYVDVSIVGENGVVECNADTLLKARVENGVLLGFGSADSRTEEKYTDGKFTTYYGKAQAVVYSNSDKPLRLFVSAEGLSERSIEFIVEKD